MAREYALISLPTNLSLCYSKRDRLDGQQRLLASGFHNRDPFVKSDKDAMREAGALFITEAQAFELMATPAWQVPEP